MNVANGADEEFDAGQGVCSDVDEALYLLTKRDPVVYDRAALTWKCFIPAKSSIETLRSHDGTLVCSHPDGTAYLTGFNVVETREGRFVDSALVLQNTRSADENIAGGRMPEPRPEPKISAPVGTLDLRGCLMDQAIVSQLSRGLTTNRFVTILSLSGNRLLDGDIALLASALVHNGYLLELTLSYNSIGEVGSTCLAKALTTNAHLRVLDLMHNRIGQDGILPWLGDTMRVNYALRELKLSHNAIGDKKTVDLLQALSPKLLTEAEQLKTRIASRRRHTTMSDGSAEPHHDNEPFNSTLRTLLLGNTGISDESSTHLAHMLSHTQSLTHLDISCNDFTREGNVIIARGLQRNASIRFLNYRENKLDEVAAVAVLRALKVSSFVEIALFQDCFGGESTVGGALGQLTKTTRSLVTLDLSHCPLEPPGVVEFYYALAENTSLRSIDLTCTGLKSDSAAGILAKSLQVNTTLTFVNLAYNEITLRGCKLLRDGVAGRSETAARLVLSLEGNSGEKCPTGTIITGGMRPTRPALANL
ncbi:ATP-binding cassette sub- C member 8 [Phytophthora pseudosyringae]|uniref:ATP-binding cassette sub- C member 8 n=1 Tax=Phytophthora pseudosyringae TaxID=221518 RepID=A0A8T1W4G7_9STRA|nr:ATP-binding cassette sub- C member 8 [Phytophthora pseudosyringae]